MDEPRVPRGVAAFGDEPVVVHFDGACEPARGGGVATFGFTVDGQGFRYEEFGLATRPYSERSTNNVAEYVAAIRALEWLQEQGYTGPARLTGDSQLVIRQMTGEYAVKTPHLLAYRERLVQLASRFRSVEYRWVPREQNTRADALSKEALRAASVTARAYRPPRPGASATDPGPTESDERVDDDERAP
jgi:ribonuclease HI